MRLLKAQLAYWFRLIILALFNAMGGPIAKTKPLRAFRSGLLRLMAIRLGGRHDVSRGFFCLFGRNLRIEEGARIGCFCNIYDYSPVIIGRNLLSSDHLKIVAGTHSIDDYSFMDGAVTIGDNVWIGIGVTIVGPVRIGSGAVVGAGALVIRDVPENAVVAGVPARLIKIKDR